MFESEFEFAVPGARRGVPGRKTLWESYMSRAEQRSKETYIPTPAPHGIHPHIQTSTHTCIDAWQTCPGIPPELVGHLHDWLGWGNAM